MHSQIGNYPTIEVGGKYVGRVGQPVRFTGGDWLHHLNDISVEIIHSIDPGPGAIQTSVELLPDGHYQELVYRAIEKQHPEVEHLGSWHSHHPNGLKHLSSGDINGYFETINDANYNIDIFIATLIISRDGFESARHFLFVRGESGYYEINPGSIKVVSTKNPYDLIIKRHRGEAFSERAGKTKRELGASTSPWYETTEGRHLLKEDRLFFLSLSQQFKAVKRGEQLIWRGTVDMSGNTYELNYEYPRDFPTSPSLVEIRSISDPRIWIKSSLGFSSQSRRKVERILKLIQEFGKDNP